MPTMVISNLPVRIVTWNVRGLGGQVKRAKVFSHLKSLSTDVAFLQETHLRTEDHIRLRKPWVGQIFHSNFNSRSRGTAILIHKRIRFISEQIISDPAGRYVIVSGILHETPVVLCNIYAPNFDNPNFVSSLISRLPNLDTHHLILGGDHNCVVSPRLDRSQSKTFTPTAMARTLSDLMAHLGCVDPWRFSHPTVKDFSYFSTVHHVYSRIDFFFIDKALLPSVKSSEYTAIVISDHAPHILDLNLLPRPPRHQGGWKLSPGLLANPEFCEYVSNDISFFLETNRSDQISPSLLWETFKAFIRGRIISFNAHLSKKRRERQQQLLDAILDVDRQQAISPSPDLTIKRIQLQVEFDLLTTGKAEYQLQRTRATYFEHGDRSSRLLASQLKHQTSSHLITQTYDTSHNLTTNPEQINLAFSSYYSDLYKSQPPSDFSTIDSFLNNLYIPTITEPTAQHLDMPLSLNEITSCIRQMQSNKAPGPDGFPVCFYKKFITQLAPLLLDVFNHSLEQGLLPPTLNQALISVILKKDKDPKLCSSYRPISLLNNDVKILAKVLATRLDSCLSSVISEDQTGFVSGRQLSFSVRRLLNTVLSPSTSKVPEIIISLDAEKAFDRVEWPYLFSVLRRFGFGSKFISWVRLLYSAPLASVKTNNNISQPFALTRGTRQGCPLSPLLFALAIEPLSIALKSSTLFSGINRGGTEHKVALYADDLLLFVQNPASCANNIVNLLKEFGKFSGYKLNIPKSVCFPVNNLAKSIPTGALPFHISQEGFKYLGVVISHTLNSIHKQNYGTLIDKIKIDLKRWNKLPLSLVGRIETIKMNILPRFLFLFQTLPLYLPKSFFKSLDAVLSSFIWAGKTPRISKSVLQRPKQDGGFALPNMLFYYWAANLQMIKKWHHSPQIIWCNMEANSCSKSSLPALLFAPLPTKYSQYTNNPVALSSLKIWNQIRQHFKFKSPSVLIPICNNHLFLPSSLDRTYNKWKEKGLISFSDLYIEGIFGSMGNIATTYDIQSISLFRFFQLRNFASTHFSSFPSLPERNIVETIMAPSDILNNISSIYSSLNSSQASSLFELRDTWERELENNLGEDLWSEVLYRINSSCACARMCLIQFKVFFLSLFIFLAVLLFIPIIVFSFLFTITTMCTQSNLFYLILLLPG